MEEEKKARDLLLAGLSYKKAAGILGRTAISLVHKNCKKWKIKNIGGRKVWTPEEDLIGSKLMLETHRFEEVAKKLGRTPSAVQRRNSCIWRIDNRGWTVEEEAKCIEMIREGRSYADISFIIGKSVKAIEQKNITRWKINTRIHAGKRRRGNGNPNFKHGQYAGDAVYRSMIDVESCARCGTTEGKIIRHHINFEHQDNYEGNLIPLCTDCHLKIHRLGRRLLHVFVDMSLLSRVSSPKGDCMEQDAYKRDILTKLEVFIRREFDLFLSPLERNLSEKEKNELGDVMRKLSKNSRKTASKLLEGYRVQPIVEEESCKETVACPIRNS